MVIVVLPLLAQDNQGVQGTLAPFGLASIAIAIVRRRYAIGGWLLYFVLQAYLGGFAIFLDVWGSLDSYNPTRWADKLRYALFLVSALPGYAAHFSLLWGLIVLLGTRSCDWVGRLKLILAVDVIVSLLVWGST